MEFSRPEYWSGLSFPFPGDLPNPETDPRSPASWAVSLPAEPQGKRQRNSSKYAEPLAFREKDLRFVLLSLHLATF